MSWRREGKQFFNWKNELIGYLNVSDGWIDFIMPKKEKHKFLIYNGWGFNKSLIAHLRILNVQRIIIKTENRILITSPHVIWSHGIEYVYKNKKENYTEEQLILPEEKMKIIKLSGVENHELV